MLLVVKSQPPIQWALVGGGLFNREQSGWGVKLTTHLHPVPRLRMYAAIPQLHLFMAWCI